MIKRMLTILAAGLALAGCTGQPQSGQPNPGGTTPPPSPTATSGQPPSGPTSAPTPEAPSGQPSAPGQPPASGRCTAAVLTGIVRIGDAAAGNRYAKLVVTNTGSVPCTLYGYGGFQLVAADGTALPTSTKRDEAPGPALVRLAPGGNAIKNLHWGVVPTGNEPVDRPCQPEPRTARVIPPDETQPFTVEWTFGPVCAAGTFHDSAYYQA
jgi:Protein of unknown function (DUF4232)